MKRNISWKESDKKYIFYMQKFLDICDNIKDQELKLRVIKSMIICDERLTNLAIDEIERLNKKSNK